MKTGAKRSFALTLLGAGGVLDRYLLSQFWASFFPLFGALFLIASVVSFVQLSAMTAVVKITFGEMALLYLAQTPQLLTYTIPITFFAGLITAFSRLSTDLETIVFFSLKASVWRVVRPFVPLAIALSITLLFLGLVVAPKAQLLQKAFVYEKQDDAQINIRESEFGQKFGRWLIFVGSREGVDRYKNIALYSRPSGEDSGFFVLAKSADMENHKGLLRMNLRDGRAYETDEKKLRQMDYSLMRVNESGRARSLEYSGLIEHWLEARDKRLRARELVWALLAGLFVPLSLVAATIGIRSPRFTKNRSGAWALALTVLFYAPAMTIGDRLGLWAFLVPPIWFALTVWLAKRRLARF